MRALALAPLLLVAACASGVPVQRQVVVAGDRFTAVQGEAAFLLRTFLPRESGGGEVTGAVCQIVSSLYSAEAVTPARVVVPNFGPQSPELVATCRAGELAGTGGTRIVTRWQQPPGAWGYPGVGPWGYRSAMWGPGWGPGWGWDGPSLPVSDYPNLIVTLR